MDHLPTPPDPYQPIILPYHEAEKFDGGDLVTYPGRCGRNIAEFIAFKRLYLKRRSVKDAILFLTMTITSLSEEQNSKFGVILHRLQDVFKAILIALIDGGDPKNLLSSIARPNLSDIASLAENEPMTTQVAEEKAQGSIGNTLKQSLTDVNLEVALEYLESSISSTVAPEDARSVTYTWSILFESLVFVIPNTEPDGVMNLDEDDTTGGLPNSPIPGQGSSKDFEIMSVNFPALAIQALHEIYPESILDLRSQFDAIDSNDRLGFLQQWLFFGTLYKAFESVDIQINLEKYISTDGPFPVLTTREFQQDMDLWEAAEKTRQGGKLRRQNKLVTLLVDVVSFALQLSMRSGSEKISDLLLAVHAICYTLEIKASRIYGTSAKSLGTLNPWLGNKLVRAGWCPHQAEILQESYIFVVVYYVYLTGTPRVRHDTSQCSKRICQLDMIQKYETLHAEWCQDGDMCSMLRVNSSEQAGDRLEDSVFRPDLEKLTSIIEAGKIPLLSFSSPVYDSSVILDVEVVEYEPSIQYITFSHVWADGMGNPDENTLPLCQVQKLRFKAREIMGDEHLRFYVWIDTLCVPVAPDKLRKAAILQMRQIYEGATAVLVFDSELMARKLSEDPAETLARIISCRWARRLWTFQEAALAQNLFFQFEDGCASMEELEKELNHRGEIIFNLWKGFEIGWWPPMRRNRDLIRSIKNILEDPALLQECSPEDIAVFRELLRNEEDMESSFPVVWSGLTRRTTQKPEDEVICVATLLDLDLKAIMETPKSERMKKLLLLQRRIPSNIIFGNMQRMQVDGFRWAPESFMAKAFRRGVAKTALCSEAGLNVQYPGIKFPGNATVITPKQLSYTMEIMPSGKREDVDNSGRDKRSEVEKGIRPFAITLGIREYEEEEVLRDWSMYRPSTYAIILEEPLVKSENDDGYSHRIYGALVSIYREGGTLSVRYIEQVTVTRGLIMAAEDKEDEGDNLGAKDNSKLESITASESRDDMSTVSKRSEYFKTLGVLMRDVGIGEILLENPIHLPQDQKWCIG